VLSTMPTSTHVGAEVALTVSVSQIEQLYSAPFYLSYNPALLELIKVSQGDFLKHDGQQTAFFHTDHPEMGRVIIGYSRLGQVDGISGSGTLTTLTFRAKTSGVGSFFIQEAEFRDATMEIIPLQVLVTEVKIE